MMKTMDHFGKAEIRLVTIEKVNGYCSKVQIQQGNESQELAFVFGDNYSYVELLGPVDLSKVEILGVNGYAVSPLKLKITRGILEGWGIFYDEGYKLTSLDDSPVFSYNARQEGSFYGWIIGDLEFRFVINRVKLYDSDTDLVVLSNGKEIASTVGSSEGVL